MPTRLRVALALLVAAAAAAAVVVALAARDRLAAATATGSADTEFAGAVRPPGIPPFDFRLRDQNGRTVALSDYRGRVVVLTFLYTTCRDTCPLQADQIRGALDDLGPAAPPALAVSVDPSGDTPARARLFVARHGLTGRMRYLLGERGRLARVWRHYGIQPQGRGFEHTAYVLLIDRAGRQRIGFPASRLTPEGLVHDVRLLAREGG